MPQKSPIEWTDYTSNPFYAVNKETGKRGWFCETISPGCGHCYSCTINVGRLGNGLQYVPANADKVDFVLNEKELLAIIALDRRLAKRGERAKLFPFDMTDLFLRHYPDEWLDMFFAVCALCPNIDFQVLTKRPERMLEYFCGVSVRWRLSGIFQIAMGMGKLHGSVIHHADLEENLRNVWLGVSAEDQKTYNERRQFLLDTPAAIRWISAEPLLGPLRLFQTNLDAHEEAAGMNIDSSFFTFNKIDPKGLYNPGLDWIVVGGESGPNARPCDIANIRSIVDQCKSAGVPVFVKQLGTRPLNGGGMFADCAGTAIDLKDRKGGSPDEWPVDLAIREFPKTAIAQASAG